MREVYNATIRLIRPPEADPRSSSPPDDKFGPQIFADGYDFFMIKT